MSSFFLNSIPVLFDDKSIYLSSNSVYSVYFGIKCFTNDPYVKGLHPLTFVYNVCALSYDKLIVVIVLLLLRINGIAFHLSMLLKNVLRIIVLVGILWA